MPISLGIGTAVTRGGGLYGPSPQLDLNFASLLSLTPSVGPTPSFTRASTGTYFDASGVLTTAAINGPRFDHVYNGVSWVSKGLLVEEQRTNLLLYSNPYIAATDRWGTTNAVLTPNAVISPDGTQNASSLIGDNAANVFQSYYYINQGSGTYTQSFYLQANGTSIIGALDYTGSVIVAWFNLSNGTTQSGSYLSTAYSSSITDVGNGWYRCTLANQSAVSMQWIHLRPVTTMGGTTPVTGTGLIGYYVYGVQAEAGSFATSLIPNNGSATTRSADVCQITGGDFSGFWNASEGAIAFDGDYLGPDSTVIRYTFGVSDTSNPSTSFIGSATNRVTSGNYSTIMYNSNALEFQLDTGTNPSSGSRIALGLAFKQNDFAISRDGGSPVIDSTGFIPPTINAMAIGSLYAFNGYMNGHIARLRYYNTRLINSQLVALST